MPLLPLAGAVAALLSGRRCMGRNDVYAVWNAEEGSLAICDAGVTWDVEGADPAGVPLGTCGSDDMGLR